MESDENTIPPNSSHKNDTSSPLSHKKPPLSLKINSFLSQKFPKKMGLWFSIAVLIKFSFFLYGVYCYYHNISPTIDACFSQFSNPWWNLEGLSDFKGDYIMFRENFLNGVPLYSEEYNGRYLYPPLYFYLVNVFSYWTIFSAPLVMLLTNIFTGYMVFHISRELGASHKQAQAIMFLYLLSPINLYYNDFIWQNAGVFMFFVIWSFRKLLKEQYSLSMFILGLAISTKQVAVFFFPIFLFGILYKDYYKERSKWMHKWTWMQYLQSVPWKPLIYYSSIPIEVFLLISLPFLVRDPDSYIFYVLGGYHTPNLYFLTLIFSNIVPVYAGDIFVGYFPDLSRLNESFYYKVNYRAALDVALAWIGYKLGLPSWVWIIVSLLFHLQLLLFLSTVICFILYWRILKLRKIEDEKEYYFVMLIAGALSYFGCILFIEKGIYKYYFISMTPFWAILGLMIRNNYSLWNGKAGLKKTSNQNPAMVYENNTKMSFSQKIKVFFLSFYSKIKMNGGSVLHIVEIILFQLILMYSNKWLLPVLFYLPLYLAMLISLWNISKPSHKIELTECLWKVFYKEIPYRNFLVPCCHEKEDLVKKLDGKIDLYVNYILENTKVFSKACLEIIEEKEEKKES